jgi:hypothetical protein
MAVLELCWIKALAADDFDAAAFLRGVMTGTTATRQPNRINYAG